MDSAALSARFVHGPWLCGDELDVAVYGWSADTAERGLAELLYHKVLYKIQRVRKEPLSLNGLGRVNDYYLLPPFGTADPASLTAVKLNALLETPS